MAKLQCWKVINVSKSRVRKVEERKRVEVKYFIRAFGASVMERMRDKKDKNGERKGAHWRGCKRVF